MNHLKNLAIGLAAWAIIPGIPILVVLLFQHFEAPEWLGIAVFVLVTAYYIGKSVRGR